MKFIKEKKINKWIVIAVLYVAFCFSYFVNSRGSVALMAINYGLPPMLDNDIFAFFVGGLMPVLIYEIITSFAFRFVRTRGCVVADDMRYALRVFYIPAMVVAGGINLIFMFYPLGSVWAFALTQNLVPAIFFALFMVWSLKTYIDKTQYSRLIFELGGTFVIVYVMIALLGLVSGVLA